MPKKRCKVLRVAEKLHFSCVASFASISHDPALRVCKLSVLDIGVETILHPQETGLF